MEPAAGSLRRAALQDGGVRKRGGFGSVRGSSARAAMFVVIQPPSKPSSVTRRPSARIVMRTLSPRVRTPMRQSSERRRSEQEPCSDRANVGVKSVPLNRRRRTPNTEYVPLLTSATVNSTPAPARIPFELTSARRAKQPGGWYSSRSGLPKHLAVRESASQVARAGAVGVHDATDVRRRRSASLHRDERAIRRPVRLRARPLLEDVEREPLLLERRDVDEKHVEEREAFEVAQSGVECNLRAVRRPHRPAVPKARVETPEP